MALVVSLSTTLVGDGRNNNCKAATEQLNLLHQLWLHFKDNFIFSIFAFPFYFPSKRRKHLLQFQPRLERGFREEEMRVSAISSSS